MNRAWCHDASTSPGLRRRIWRGEVRVGRWEAVRWLMLLSLIAPPLPAAGQGITEVIAISGNAPPEGNGTLDSFEPPALNNAGEVAFSASLAGTSGGTNDNEAIYRGDVGSLTRIARELPHTNITSGLTGLLRPALNDSSQVLFEATSLRPLSGAPVNGIFRGSGGPLTTIALVGNAAPDSNGTFFEFFVPALNDAGQAAFHAVLTGTSGGASDDGGVFLGSGGPLTQIAREGQAAPDGNGNLFLFGSTVLNDSGQAAFTASLSGTSGGLSDNFGIFLGAGGPLTQIAREGQAAPDGNGTFFSFQPPSLNESGQVAFYGFLAGTSGGTSDNLGIFLGSGGPLTQIARKGQAAPDGNGTLFAFDNPALNDSGQAAFTTDLAGTNGGASDDRGIFLGSGGVLTQIAREGQAAPDGNGTLSGFSEPALNASGQAAFHATLTGTSGGASDDTGIFLGNGIDILQVAREGDALAGSTVTVMFVNNSTGASGDERSGINDAKQVAYIAGLANGDEAIVRFTVPDLHWTAAGSGSWTTNGNWTQATEPNSFHDTFINPDTSLTVTAPSTNKTVESLTFGGGAGLTTLRLTGTTQGDLRALEASTIDENGELHLTNGRTFAAPSLSSSGFIRGDGTVDALVSNSGEIESIGNELTFSQLVTNNASTGLIIGRDAIYRFHGGLANHGAMALSFGTSDIHGEIDNAGSVVVSGNSNASFFDDVTNGGEIRVSAGSTAVFFGALSGNGTTGTGTVFLEGDVQPGLSPTQMSFGGDVHFGFFSELEIELGGLKPGDEHDQLVIAGDATLAGALSVSLIDRYTLSAGDVFEIVRIDGARSGIFSGLAEGAIIGNFGGSELLITYTAGDGNDVALFTPGLAGDYNHDGSVDAADYTLWRDTLGSTTNLAADGDASGTVDADDYTVWKINFGATAAGATAVPTPANVPEPSCWVLMMFASALSAAARRLRRYLRAHRPLRPTADEIGHQLGEAL